MADKKQIVIALLRQADSEESLGNLGAATLFRTKATDIAATHFIDLDSLDISFESASAKVLNELGQTSISNIFNRVNARTNLRKLWYEELAKVVAEGYSCRVSPNLNDGSVIFFGYDLDREIATFMFIKLAEVANDLCLREMKIAKSNVGKPPSYNFKTQKQFVHPKEWMDNDVWIDNFHKGFREEIAKFLSNRPQDDTKVVEVVKFFDKNKDDNSYRYYYSYRSQSVWEADFNEQAFSIGKICGYNIAHKADKSPSALTIKKSIISNKNKVIILVDNSVSMNWHAGERTPIAQAREGTLEFARTAFAKKQQVDVIAFSDKAIPVATNVEEFDEKFEEQVRGIKTIGGTNLTDALKLAQSKFLSRNVERTIMIVTDGMPNDETSALQIANDCKRMGIKIMAIGCGTANQEFIDKLTSPGMGLLVDSSRLMLTIGEFATKL